MRTIGKNEIKKKEQVDRIIDLTKERGDGTK